MVKNELIQEILKLDATDREYIRDVVLASLTDDLPTQLTPQDQVEILKRIDAYEQSPEKFTSWETVKARLAAKRAG